MLGLILLFIIIYYLIRNFCGPLYRLGYKNNIKSSILLNSKDILKNRLTESNLQVIDSEFDYIIIGSGISGLTSASILSFLGNKVLVLEQHDVVGGALHVFKDKGYLFDVGLHYVGQPKQSIKDILKIITDPDIPIKFYEMNGEWGNAGNKLDKVYDTFVSGDKTINLKSGKEGFIQAFIEHDEFKQYEQEIRELTNDIIKKDNSSTYYYLSKTYGKYTSILIKFLFGRKYMKFNEMNGYQYLKQFISNDKLIYTIGGSIGDLGRSLKSTPSFCIKGILRHYINGGYYPGGGSERLVKSMASNILKRGGHILVNARVKEIITKNNKIVGVKVRKGTSEKEWVIKSKNVISSAGIKNTFRLAKINDHINNTQYYQNFVMTFVGLNKESTDLDIYCNNTWIRSEPIDQDILIKKFTDCCLEFLDTGNTEQFNCITPPMFISPNSPKDPYWKLNPDNNNKTTVTLIGLVDRRLYNRLELDGLLEQKVDKRNIEYQELKKLIEETMIRCFLKQYPKAKGAINYTKTATPITFNHYLESYKGNCYGIGVSQPNFYTYFDDARIGTSVKGLYMVGQDIVSPGIFGAMESGILLIYKLLGYNKIQNIIIDRIIGVDPINDILGTTKT